jgi:hypothetical protein
MKAVFVQFVWIIVSVALWAAPSAQAQGIQVLPGSLDFGELDVGSSADLVVTVANVGAAPVLVLGVAITPDSSGDFVIKQGPSGPVLLPSMLDDPANGSFAVTVRFTPSAEGSASGVLRVQSSDFLNPAVDVALAGSGLSAVQPPDAQVQQILTFISSSVAAGTLEGAGPNARSAKNRLRALVSMIEEAGSLLAAGSTQEARDKLEAIYRKLDGNGRPGDFVAGPAVSELTKLIRNLISDLAG